MPTNGGLGGQWREHRQLVDAIVWKLRTGAPWRDLPEWYGRWKSAPERLRRWAADGRWQAIVDEVIVKDDAAGELEWVVSVDSSVIRAHRTLLEPGKRGLLTPGRGHRRRG